MWESTYWISFAVIIFVGLSVVAPGLLAGVLISVFYLPSRNLYRKAKDWQPPNFADWWPGPWGTVRWLLAILFVPILGAIWLIAKTLHFTLVRFLELSGSSPEKIEEEVETIDNFFDLGR